MLPWTHSVYLCIFEFILHYLIVGVCKWKPGCWCAICQDVCCWWWWMPHGSKLCEEHGFIRGACWCTKYCKWLPLPLKLLICFCWSDFKWSTLQSFWWLHDYFDSFIITVPFSVNVWLMKSTLSHVSLSSEVSLS